MQPTNSQEIKPIANGSEYAPKLQPIAIEHEIVGRKKLISLLLVKILLIISPGLAAVLFGYLSNYTSSEPGNMAIGVWLIMIFVFGIPFVAIVGLIASVLSRKANNAEAISVCGYLVPAVLTWLMASTVLFS